MFQTIKGRTYYVVEIKKFPLGVPVTDRSDPALTQYADALNQAIDTGLVTKPGKYAIGINTAMNRWDIFEVHEPKPALPITIEQGLTFLALGGYRQRLPLLPQP